MTFFRIEAPHFVAGGELDGRHAYSGVISSAPIIHYMRGWTVMAITAYCRKKGWKLEIHHDHKD